MREILCAGEDVLMRVRYVSPPGGFTCQMVMGYLACEWCCLVGSVFCWFGVLLFVCWLFSVVVFGFCLGWFLRVFWFVRLVSFHLVFSHRSCERITGY